MAVLPQQSVCILAGSIPVSVLPEISHQEVSLLLVIGPSEQALQNTTISSQASVHTQALAQADFWLSQKLCASDKYHKSIPRVPIAIAACTQQRY